jgi:MFS family permease
MMSLSTGINLLPVFLTALGVDLGGLDKEQLGRIPALTFVGLVAGIAVTGPLADRWGAKVFAQLGNLLILVGLVGLCLAPTYFLVCIASVAIGFGSGQIDMVLSPVVAALNPERRASAMNWLHSFYCVGAVMTVLVSTFALHLGLSWRWCSLLMAPLPLGLLIAFAPLRFPAMIHESARVPFAALLRDRWFLAALAGILLGGATELGMAQWLPAYAEQSLHYPAWVGGTGLLLFSLTMAGGRMVAGALPRLDPFWVMAAGGAASVAFFIGGSFLPWPAVALACCILAGFAGSPLWPTMLGVTANRFPNGGATMFGALAAVGNAGGIVMPWMVGFVADRAGLAIGLALAAIAPALLIPLVLWMRAQPHAQGLADHNAGEAAH